MPRIRTVKPEFWDSPDTAKASYQARLLYIAMWNWADDWGVGTANPKTLAGFAFPNDDVTPKHLGELLNEVRECFGVILYQSAGRPYYAVRTWDEHQRTERKARRVNPPPPERVSAGQSTVTEVPTPCVGNADDGTGEQGKRNRGTGEVEKARKRAAQLPDDWQPSDKHQALAAELGVNLTLEATKFRDYCEANGKTYKNHDSAFNNWLRNAKQFSGNRKQRGEIDWDAANQRAIARDGVTR